MGPWVGVAHAIGALEGVTEVHELLDVVPA
jgi:hypothetical protein